MIVVDHELSGRSGAELVQDLACYGTTPIVLVADDASSDSVRALNRRGDTVVLLRPLSPGELEAWVRYEVVSGRLRSRTLVA